MLTLACQFCEALLLPTGSGAFVAALLWLATPHQPTTRQKEPQS